MNLFSKVFWVGLALAAVQLCQAQEHAPLRFSNEGKFKIVQFTDTHFKWGKKASEKAVECMQQVMDAEKPDLVVITGDMVYSDSVANSLPALLTCIADRQIPFVTVFGNHDHQFDCTYAEMYDIIRSIPYNIQPDRYGVDSPDYVLSVLSSQSENPALALYCFDSHDTSSIKELGGYAWMNFDQINWYRQISDTYKEDNGGTPLPSLAFFHIPFPEYTLASADENNVMIGTKKENCCPPKLNSGMFTAMKEKGDIMATFCGHDHDNDFTVMYYGILLGYGRYTGGNTVYNHIGLNGGRVILLDEGQRKFETWIRLSDGTVIDQSVYPDTYLSKKEARKAKKTEKKKKKQQEEDAIYGPLQE